MPKTTARWLIVVLLSVIATCLLIEVGAGTSRSTAAPVKPGTDGGLFAVAGQVTRGTYGMYLVDQKRGSVCLYEYDANTQKLHLRASRNITFDLMLDAYNTEILPHEVKTLVEQHRRLKAKSDE